MKRKRNDGNKPPIFCADCGADSMVYDTRHRGEHVWRRRRCSKHPQKHRWTTIEIMVAIDKGQSSPGQAARAIRRAVMLDLIEHLKSQVPECDGLRVSSNLSDAPATPE